MLFASMRDLWLVSRLNIARRLVITALARSPSLTTASRAARASSIFGGFLASKISAAWLLLVIAAIGWVTSWAMEAAIASMAIFRPSRLLRRLHVEYTRFE